MITEKYSITRMIYASGNSRVYEAVDTASGAQVALKTGTASIMDARSVGRLKKEHRLLGLLDSPHVPKSLALTTQGETTYLVLEYCPGASLAHRLREGALPLEDFFPLALNVVRGLCHIHHAGIIHKDMNPANIVWDPQSGSTKVIDLSLASEFSHEKPSGRNYNELEGSIYYISPEQTGRMNAIVDFRTDFYSLGATFYEILSGKPPFVSEGVMEIIFAHMAKVPPPVQDLAPHVPGVLSQLIAKLLSKMPAERYNSAEGLLHDLEHCAALHAQGKADEFFALGQADFNRQFELSQKIFGREAEVLQLKNDYEEVLRGGRVLVALSGYSGVGKTSLVQELQEAVFYSHGLFLRGKFDQYHKDVPFYAFFQALEQFGNHIIAESDTTAAQWKKKLEAALGDNASLLTTKVAGLSLCLASSLCLKAWHRLKSARALRQLCKACWLPLPVRSTR